MTQDRASARAFVEELFALHQAEIYSYLARMVRDDELAADLTQETFVKAYRAFETLEDAARARSWLYQIASRTALDELRRRRIIRFIPWTGESRGTEVSAEDAALHGRLSGEMERALAAIPERQRNALLLAEVHDLTGLELAAALGVSHVAARAAHACSRVTPPGARRGAGRGRLEDHARRDAAPRRGEPVNAATDHARYRELLSRRLDERLAAADARELQQHLAGCPRCRVVDREYRRQRQALRGLAPVTPPRDLGARTAAALDREVAGSGASRWRRQPRRRRRRSGFALAGLAALAVVVVLAAAVIGVLRPSVNAPIALQPAQNRPTPFAVPPQELALVGEDPGGLKLYRASVDRVCPPSAANCTSLRPSNSQPLGSSGVSVPSTVVVGPTGDRAAITGRDSTGRQVYAVVQLPPTGSATRRGTAGATGEPAQSASPPPTPGSSPSSTAGAAASTASPSPGASPTPRTAPASASVTGPPAATTSPSPASTGAAASASPGTTGSAAGGTEPPPGGSAGPSPSATAGSPPPTATPTVAATLEATLPPGSALPADARPILRDVLAAGAPPAWSADGQVLAFSAMPADASHGPDIYTWRPGDREALRITDDHSTYFGSWAGSRIVASRTVAGRGSSTALSARDLEAVVIDPASREVRPVRDAAMWLPSVDPTSRWVVYWHGRLERDGATVRPVAGRLVIADWRSLDPFETAPDDAGSPSSPRAVAVASGGAPVEWQLRWSDDGRAYGVWTPDSRGAATGRLVVVAVGDETSDQDTVLLGPTASTRAFTLGEDRVAWVAPGTGGKAGELRVGTWGKSGKGSLRVDVVDGGALPDF